MMIIEQIWTDYCQRGQEIKQFFSQEDMEHIQQLLDRNESEYMQQGLGLLSSFGVEVLFDYLELHHGQVNLKKTLSNQGLKTDILMRLLLNELLESSECAILFELDAFRDFEMFTMGKLPLEEWNDLHHERIVHQSQNMVKIKAATYRSSLVESHYPKNSAEIQNHQMILSQDFWMGRYLVTQALYKEVMGELPTPMIYQPHFIESPHKPVEFVSWLDCIEFCNQYSQMQDLTPVYQIQDQKVICDWDANGYRLPTETEWHYCALESGQPYVDTTMPQVGSGKTFASLRNVIHPPVGMGSPNSFGLYDTHSAVWEWCWDIYHPNYYRLQKFQQPIRNLKGLKHDLKGTLPHVLRGGILALFSNWHSRLRYAKSNSQRSKGLGFRLCRNAEENQ